MTTMETALLITLILCVMLVLFSAQLMMLYLHERKYKHMWRNAFYDQWERLFDVQRDNAAPDDTAGVRGDGRGR